MAVSTIPNPNPTDIQLHASDNLNNVSQTGTYFWAKENDSYPSNVPESINSGMIVISRGNIPIQIVIANSLTMYFRVKYTSGWQGWRKVTATAV